MEKNRKKTTEKKDENAKATRLRKIRSAGENTAATRRKNSTIQDGNRSVK